jgi:hypothetical protein
LQNEEGESQGKRGGGGSALRCAEEEESQGEGQEQDQARMRERGQEIDGGGQRDKFFVDDILDVFNVTVTNVAETRHNLLCKSLVLGAAAHFGITGEINFMGALVF